MLLPHNPKVAGSNPAPATNEEVQVRGHPEGVALLLCGDPFYRVATGLYRIPPRHVPGEDGGEGSCHVVLHPGEDVLVGNPGIHCNHRHFLSGRGDRSMRTEGLRPCHNGNADGRGGHHDDGCRP
jgi:hypothetical protein